MSDPQFAALMDFMGFVAFLIFVLGAIAILTRGPEQ